MSWLVEREDALGLFGRDDGPLVMEEHPTGARRTVTRLYLFGLLRCSFDEVEMTADIVYGGAGYVDSDTVTYWKRGRAAWALGRA